VINLSLGINENCSQARAVQDVINYAGSNGSVVVVSAGNENQDTSNMFPASCSGVITVAATSKEDQRASYSNFGPNVDIAAPGGDGVYTTDGVMTTDLNNQIYYMRGTSASAPHVAGVVALMLAKSPQLTPDQIETLLKDNADPITTDQPIGKRLNAYQVLAALNLPTPTFTPLPTPSPPPTFTITQLKTSLLQYLDTDDNQYRFVDGKINMLDSVYMIRWLQP
jgi:serine protease